MTDPDVQRYKELELSFAFTNPRKITILNWGNDLDDTNTRLHASLQAFSLPSGSYTPSPGGRFYINAFPDGNLLVHDASGVHLYSLAAVAPEPASLALLSLTALPRIATRRRRRI